MKQTNTIIIMDGFAESEQVCGNAIISSGTPNITKLKKTYPFTTLGASGTDVGLPEGFMGNSEVGHTNIGAGRVVYQYFSMINKAISEGDFNSNEAFITAIDNAKNSGKKLHLMGLLSDGGVHSHIDHLFALLTLAKERGLDEAFIHVFTDGRDTAPDSAGQYLAQLTDFCDKQKFGAVASICGRYYAMDRDKNFDRTQKAYNMLTFGEGEHFESATVAVDTLYKRGLSDEFFTPCILAKKGKIESGDSVIFFNFRSDRAKQITAALTSHDFTSFDAPRLSPTYVCMTTYDKSLKNVLIAFHPQNLNNTLSEYLSKCGKTQLHIAETEKFAHVTKFFNANSETKYEGEDWLLINSPKVATFDLVPEMSAHKITDAALASIESGKYDAVIINFANCDMVGHTGNFEATVKAVSVVDECVGKVVTATIKTGGACLITADHGNAERMIENGTPMPTHTTNRVPFILADESLVGASLHEGGILADIAPTFLAILKLPIPKEMTGKNLISVT